MCSSVWTGEMFDGAKRVERGCLMLGFLLRVYVVVVCLKKCTDFRFEKIVWKYERWNDVL